MRLLHVKFSNPFDAYSPLLLLEAAEFALIPIGKERYQEPSGCHCRQSRSAKRVDDPALVESWLELAFNGVIRDLISTTARKGTPIAIFWTWAIRYSITKSAFELCGCRIFRSQKYRSLNLNDKETIAYYLFLLFIDRCHFGAGVGFLRRKWISDRSPIYPFQSS